MMYKRKEFVIDSRGNPFETVELAKLSDDHYRLDKITQKIVCKLYSGVLIKQDVWDLLKYQISLEELEELVKARRECQR